MWKRAVWLEGKKEEEGVVPSSWVLEENQTLFWPQGVNAENALHNQQEPDPASWRKFMLKKVKITSGWCFTIILLLLDDVHFHDYSPQKCSFLLPFSCT